MNPAANNRNWVILYWNIRGINDDRKWDAVKSKINESGCDILCLQETKREVCDVLFVKNFCHSRMDDFVFLPSAGNSGGSLIAWNSSKFDGQLIFQNNFAQPLEFSCNLSGENWILTNIYAPCTSEGKLSFLNWFKNIDMPIDTKWLIVGDFNLMRSPDNRNKHGGNLQEMFAFNEAISKLRLVELPLKGCKFTWTNKQHSPLLERLDWFFTSNAWTTAMPNTIVSALSRDTSDHTPCVISASTKVPRPQIFRFENF
jgi:mannosylglycoprotein endo-beta-mannosidase